MKMGKIKAYVGYSERKNQFYSKSFTVVEELPTEVKPLEEVLEDGKILEDNNTYCVGIEPAMLDPEQPNNDVYNYEYYLVKMFDIETYKWYKEDNEEEDPLDHIEENYVCIPYKRNTFSELELLIGDEIEEDFTNIISCFENDGDITVSEGQGSNFEGHGYCKCYLAYDKSYQDSEEFRIYVNKDNEIVAIK